MAAVLWLFAFVEFAFGVMVLISAKSAIHEILATLAIGFSLLTAGLAIILAEIKEGSVKKLTQDISEIKEHLAAMRRYYEPNH